jgi:hypothetical protein
MKYLTFVVFVLFYFCFNGLIQTQEREPSKIVEEIPDTKTVNLVIENLGSSLSDQKGGRSFSYFNSNPSSNNLLLGANDFNQRCETYSKCTRPYTICQNGYCVCVPGYK